MNFMELAAMPDAEQENWMAEHSEEECKAIVEDWLEAMRRDSIDYKIKQFREHCMMHEISAAVAAGNYSGVTNDGRTWRIDFDSDHMDDDNDHMDDWRDSCYGFHYF